MKHPYQCTTTGCRKRKSYPKGTQDYTESCPALGCKGIMKLDRARVERPELSCGKPCDCNGSKGKREDKIVYRDEVAIVLGPHRKGQKGCMYNLNYGKSAFRDEDPCPF